MRLKPLKIGLVTFAVLLLWVCVMSTSSGAGSWQQSLSECLGLSPCSASRFQLPVRVHLARQLAMIHAYGASSLMWWRQTIPGSWFGPAQALGKHLESKQVDQRSLFVCISLSFSPIQKLINRIFKKTKGIYVNLKVERERGWYGT